MRRKSLFGIKDKTWAVLLVNLKLNGLQPIFQTPFVVKKEKTKAYCEATPEFK